MGAMYQMVPVTFLVSIWSIRLGFVQFVITAAGILSLAASFFIRLDWLPVSGGLTLLGLLIFLLQMVMSMKSQKEKNILFLFVLTALLCLFLTIMLGLLLSISLGFGRTVFDHLAILKSHILLGLAGWFTLLIMGFSYKLVPMFSLAHGFSMKLSRWVFGIYITGLALSTVSFFSLTTNLFTTGLILLFAGFTLFTVHIGQLLKKRMKKRLDKGFLFSLSSIAGGWLIHLSAAAASFFPGQEGLFGRLVYLYIFVWITFTISGYLFKIVPVLWWTYKYSGQAGQKGTPLLKDLIRERSAVIIFTLFAVSACGIVAAFILAHTVLFSLSQALFFAATALFCTEVIRVLTR